jgi:hypothetical protein
VQKRSSPLRYRATTKIISLGVIKKFMAVPILRKLKRKIDKTCEDSGEWLWGKKRRRKPGKKSKTPTNPFD